MNWRHGNGSCWYVDGRTSNLHANDVAGWLNGIGIGAGNEIMDVNIGRYLVMRDAGDLLILLGVGRRPGRGRVDGGGRKRWWMMD